MVVGPPPGALPRSELARALVTSGSLHSRCSRCEIHPGLPRGIAMLRLRLMRREVARFCRQLGVFGLLIGLTVGVTRGSRPPIARGRDARPDESRRGGPQGPLRPRGQGRQMLVEEVEKRSDGKVSLGGRRADSGRDRAGHRIGYPGIAESTQAARRTDSRYQELERGRLGDHSLDRCTPADSHVHRQGLARRAVRRRAAAPGDADDVRQSRARRAFQVTTSPQTPLRSRPSARLPAEDELVRRLVRPACGSSTSATWSSSAATPSS